MKHYGYNTLPNATKKMVETIIGKLYLDGFQVHTVGSRKVKGGYDKDSDYDFLVPLSSRPAERNTFTLNRFELGGSEVPTGRSFKTYKKQDKEGNTINFILSWGRETQEFLASQDVVEKLQITNKDDRIEVFEFMRGGSSDTRFKEVCDKYTGTEG